MDKTVAQIYFVTDVQPKLVFASFCLNENVNENEIKTLAFDRGPDYVTGKLDYQGRKIHMKIAWSTTP